MLFREIVAVYCENHTHHRSTLCGHNAEFLNVETVRNGEELAFAAPFIEAVAELDVCVAEFSLSERNGSSKRPTKVRVS